MESVNAAFAEKNPISDERSIDGKVNGSPVVITLWFKGVGGSNREFTLTPEGRRKYEANIPVENMKPEDYSFRDVNPYTGRPIGSG